MKSLNVKKIAVAALGAAMIGAAFAGAVSVPSTLSNYQFFSSGTPQVKIVVGSAAQASDAVAAANIAAMIGNLAYTSTPVSINGETGLSCSGSAGTASCNGGSATLQVTTPGINPATSYQMTTLINSALNANYSNSLTAQTRNGTATMPGILGQLNNGYVSDTLNAKITPSQTQLLKTTPLNIQGNPVSEEEDIYAGATNAFSTITNTIQSNQMGAYYTATFTPSLPMCTNTADSINTSASNYCDANGNLNLIGDTQNTIQFLGQPWVIVSPSNSSGISYDSTSGNVTSIQLAQGSAINQVLYAGQSVKASNGVIVTLNTMTGSSGGAGGFYASFFVTATDGTNQTITMVEGEQKVIDGVTISVAKGNVFPGMASAQQYVVVSVYSNTITLGSNNQQITGTGGVNYGNWYSRFVEATNSNTMGISEILIYPLSSSIINQQNAGNSFSMITNSPLYNLNYMGLTNVTTSPLNFQMITPAYVTVNMTNCPSQQLNFNAVQITGSNNGLYDQNNGGNSFTTGYMVIGNVTPQNTTTCTTQFNPGEVFYPIPGNTNGYYYNTSIANVGFKYSSSLNTNPSFNYSTPTNLLTVQEYTAGPDSNPTGVGTIGVYVNNVTNQFVDLNNATSADSIYYTDSNGSVGYNNTAEKVGFITDRGSVITGISSNSVTINYANSLAGVIYTLTPSGVNTSTSNSVNYTLTPGQSQDLGSGYSVELMTVGAGTSGTTGGNATVSGVSGLSASPANAATVVPLNTASTPLVEFDSQASTSQNLIVVGGPMVNTVAASIASQAGVSLNAPGDAVVQLIGQDILVAGYTAADTQSAANALIAWMAQNAASIAH
jgi:hypothetical protein